MHAENHADYLAEILAEADRARRDYGLLLLPGLELTYNDPDPSVAAHAVAAGCRTFVGVDIALVRAREAGAAIIAAHPYLQEDGGSSPARATTHFSHDWRELTPHIDRWELFNRYELFGWVAERGLPAVATATSTTAGIPHSHRRHAATAGGLTQP